MILRTLSCTFALVLACGPDKDGSAETSSTDETQTANTGASDPTAPATSTDTGEASTGGGDDVTGSSISISTSETGAMETTATTGDTEMTGATEGTTGDLPPGACRSHDDCSNEVEFCNVPGDIPCGACEGPEIPCSLDLDEPCGQGLICAPFTPECVCDPDARGCVPPCDADSCGRGASCNAVTGVCEPFTCSKGEVTCPPLFICVPDSGGDECQRLACTTDAACGGMPCVHTRCYENFGWCGEASAPP